MYFEIVELDEFSGDKAHIYSVCVDGNDNSLFDEFLLENEQYQDWLNEILVKLQNMGNNTGCRRGFFRHEEGKPGDGVAALRVGQLRLYCLYFDNTAVIFGSGGYKSPDIRSYQEDLAMYISKHILKDYYGNRVKITTSEEPNLEEVKKYISSFKRR